MKESIRSNYEKVLLAFLLIALAATSVISIMLVRFLPEIKLVGGGDDVIEESSTSKMQFASSSLLSLGKSKSLQNYVYCRKSECNYLIHNSLVKCNWCGTSIESEIEEDNKDRNKNDVPDKLEIEWGLSLDDSDGLFRDQDKDGFRNIDEYRMDYSPIEKDSHPALVFRFSFHGVSNKFIPFKINDVVFVKDVRGNERIYVDGKHEKRGSFYLAVGEETDWLKVLEAGKENGKKYVILQYHSLKFTLGVNERRQYDGWPKYIVKNGLTDKKQLISKGKSFFLTSLNGTQEKYTMKSHNAETKSIKVFSDELQKDFNVNNIPKLLKPIN